MRTVKFTVSFYASTSEGKTHTFIEHSPIKFKSGLLDDNKSQLFTTKMVINSKYHSSSHHENTSIAVSVNAPKFHNGPCLYQHIIGIRCLVMSFITIIKAEHK